MSILFQDTVVDVVFIDYSILGTQIRFIERLERDETLYEKIAELLKSTEKIPALVTLFLPRENIMQRTLRYPAIAKNEIKNMVQLEATRHVPLPEEDRAIAWSAATSADEKQLILNLIATRKSTLTTFTQAFEEEGVPIDEIIPFNAAIATTLGENPSLLLLVDSKHVEVSLYGDNQLQDSQWISLQESGIDSDQIVTLARQIMVRNKKWLGDEGINRIWLTNRIPLPENLQSDLETQFGVHVYSLQPPEDFDVDETFSNLLLATQSPRPPTLNLLENKRRKIPLSKRTLIITGLSLLLFLELTTAIIVKTNAPKQQRKQVAKELVKIRKKIAPIQKMKKQNRELEHQLAKMNDLCHQKISVMTILQSVSDTLPMDSYLQYFSYRKGSGISFRGASKRPERLPELLQALPIIDTITKSDLGRKIGEYQSFSMSATIKESP